MRELGVEVLALRAEPPRIIEWFAMNGLTLARIPRVQGPSLRARARLSRTISLFTGPEMSALRTRGLRRQIREAGPLDAIVQIGTAYGVPSAHHIATFEDMTVAQALALPYEEWRSLSAREKQAALDRQAAGYRQAAVCCFATQWAADSAIRDYGVPAAKTRVVGVGRNHSPRPTDRDWTNPRFLFIGGDWARKNGDAVIRTFSRVRERIPDAKLDVVGNHPRLDVEGVTGHGWLSLGNAGDREKVDELFERATCFVMPSLFEPCGIVYLEAGAAGVPSIGSTVGGSRELIAEGGCVVEPTDLHALYEAMVRFGDAETARDAGARALARADDFTWQAVAERVLTALRETTAGS